VERPYVGIDLHRRRSVIYSMDAAGEKLDCVRMANDPLTLLEVVSKAGPEAEVVIEATYGWYWAVDLLQDAGDHRKAALLRSLSPCDEFGPLDVQQRVGKTDPHIHVMSLTADAGESQRA
jgi:hypothetical protein